MISEVEKIYTWWADAAFIFLRYFIIAGAAYFIFYIWQQKKYLSIKIQSKIPQPRKVRSEIFYSIITLLIFCAVSWLIFDLKKHGLTKIYLDPAEFGYTYFAFSIVLMVFIHDAYFYWTHRLMHHPRIFKLVHLRHHLSDNPTPWSAFSFHPVEAIIAAGIIPVIVFLIPTHPYAIFIFLTFMTLINVMGHLGYETFPMKFRKSKIGIWQNTSTNHNIHHQRSAYNYGLYFTFWDRLMGTYKSEDKESIVSQPQ